jgi:hypothetical protein
MKKILLIIVFALYSFTQFGQTTYFSQDFLANTTVSSYVGSPASNNQFTEIPTVTGITNTINTGRYRIAKSGTTAVNYRFGRCLDFASEPKSMYCQFSFGVATAPTTTKDNAIVLSLGGSGILDGAALPTVANTYAKLSFGLVAGGLTFRLNDGTNNSTNFTGNYDITFVMNNTGATFTYIAPDGTNETLGNDLFDVWVGTTKVFNERPVITATQSIKRFRFDFTLDAAPANAPTVSFDNFLMRDVTGSLLVNNNNTVTPDSMLVKYIGTPKNVGIGKNITTPANKLEVKSDTLDRSGLRLTNLKSTSTPSSGNGKALSVNASGDVILVNSASLSTPDSMLVKSIGIGKNVGIGKNIATPANKLEIKSDTLNQSGLRLTNLKSTATTTAGNGKALSVNTFGDVILVNSTSSSIPDSMIVQYSGSGTNKTVSINNKLEISATPNDNSGLRFTKLTSASTAPTGNGKVLSVDATGNVILVKDSLGATSNVVSLWQTIAGNRIQNTNTGAIVIGALNTTNLPGNYKLYVKDGIMAEEVKIAVQGTNDWADYVFASNYKLRPLSEVENFVKANKHLPEVPSAEEVVKNGVNVVKMEAKLLEKIEELTLYMIELKKENDNLKKRLDKMEKRK